MVNVLDKVTAWEDSVANLKWILSIYFEQKKYCIYWREVLICCNYKNWRKKSPQQRCKLKCWLSELEPCLRFEKDVWVNEGLRSPGLGILSSLIMLPLSTDLRKPAVPIPRAVLMHVSSWWGGLIYHERVIKVAICNVSAIKDAVELNMQGQQPKHNCFLLEEKGSPRHKMHSVQSRGAGWRQGLRVTCF